MFTFSTTLSTIALSGIVTLKLSPSDIMLVKRAQGHKESEVLFYFSSFFRKRLRRTSTKEQWRTQKTFMGGFIQWHMGVICIWCAFFVTSQFDVIFMFSSEVC